MRPSRYALAAVLGAHALLVFALLRWCGWLPGLFLSLPLLVTLPGLLRARTYTAGWASMLLVFYVAGLLAEGVAIPARRVAGFALSALAAFDFLSLIAFVRLAARERAIAAARTERSGGAAR